MNFLNKLSNMPELNVGGILDIPTGKFINQLQDPKTILNGGAVLPNHSVGRKTFPSFAILSQMRIWVEKTVPNTEERWYLATCLLRYMGYSVKWEDVSKCPTVIWYNFEGNGEDEAQMIKDILHKDYRNDLSH